MNLQYSLFANFKWKTFRWRS